MQGSFVERALERKTVLWKEPWNIGLFCGKTLDIEGSFAERTLECKDLLGKEPYIRYRGFFAARILN